MSYEAREFEEICAKSRPEFLDDLKIVREHLIKNEIKEAERIMSSVWVDGPPKTQWRARVFRFTQILKKEIEEPWTECEISYKVENFNLTAFENEFGVIWKRLPYGWSLREIITRERSHHIIFKVEYIPSKEEGLKIKKLLNSFST